MNATSPAPTAPPETNLAGRASAALNRWVEYLCAAILAALVIVVWIGVFGRYVFELPVTWAEELSRYLMIWAALLAVSCGVARRGHVAVTALLHLLPVNVQRWANMFFDILAFAFFAFLCAFGVGMARDGLTQYATIFGMTMFVPFAAVPVSSALVCTQLLLVGWRDFGSASVTGEAS